MSSSCGTSDPTTPSKEQLPVITVNGVAIPEKDLANELQYHPNANFAVVVQQAGQALVIRQLLINEAKKHGLLSSSAESSNEEEAIQKVVESNISYEAPNEDICQRYYENNKEKFMTMPLMEVDHILLAAAKDDIEGRDAAENNAKVIISQLLQEIKNGEPSSFAALAKEYSACPSKENGGNLGQLSKGQTVPEFERQLMLLSEGISDKAIETRYGFHVVNINRKIEGKQLEYDMVSDKVRGYLINSASHLAIQAYIQSLVEKADIQGVPIKFSDENIHI
ncbi:peptidyl-prolyl cis-trans isomerase [Colwellia sp. MSW7]|uniref:peptidylprolyl isomerase n=1 Tax=Colwellia maritima TaxID=2912588 RepID=A0ABS9WY78_9GAMM|nr:peptidylprolyl isomerase [Colwellia maritima]MCI2282958.1 peptidyl-prolyl cis-trans isomerase [Colwellia maritima]